jgi:hypothetical protein
MKNTYYSYTIHSKECLITEYYSGQFSFPELQKCKAKLFADEQFNAEYDIISDVSGVGFLFHYSEIDSIAHKISRNKDVFDHHKTAFITDTPEQVVKLILLRDCIEARLRFVKIGIFSSLHAALNWQLIGKKGAQKNGFFRFRGSIYVHCIS